MKRRKKGPDKAPYSVQKSQVPYIKLGKKNGWFNSTKIK
jgi:hypothetical protein